MTINMLGLIGAAAGGFLGAAFGALVAFVFTGFAVLAGIAALVATGNAAFLNSIAFGGFFGPHISFAAGIAAVAYAYRRGYISTGRDIVTPLVSLAKPDVLLVGSLFGILGYVVQQAIVMIPVFGSKTDSLATTVVLSAILARVLFGRSGIVGTPAEGSVGWKRFECNAEHRWIDYQQAPLMAGLLGLFVGGMSAWSSVTLLRAYPDAPGAIYLGFGISAISVMFLGFGIKVPVTHHITLVPAVFVGAFIDHVYGGDVGVVVLAAIVGAITALLGEVFSRLWLIRGDTHIDPPASAIWPMTVVILSAAAVLHN